MYKKRPDLLSIIPNEDDIILEDVMDTGGLKGKLRRVETENAIYYLFKENDDLFIQAVHMACKNDVGSELPIYIGYDDKKLHAVKLDVPKELPIESDLLYERKEPSGITLTLNGKTISVEDLEEEWEKCRYQMILGLRSVGKDVDPALQKIAECKDYTNYYQKDATYEIDGKNINFEHKKTKKGNSYIVVSEDGARVYDKAAANLIKGNLDIIEHQRSEIFNLNTNRDSASAIEEYLTKADALKSDINFNYQGSKLRLHILPSGDKEFQQKVSELNSDGQIIFNWIPVCMADIQDEYEKNPYEFNKRFNIGYEKQRDAVLRILNSRQQTLDSVRQNIIELNENKKDEDDLTPLEPVQGEKTPEELSVENKPGEHDKNAPEEPVKADKAQEEPSMEHTLGDADKDTPEEPVKGDKTPVKPFVEHTPGERGSDAPLESVQGVKMPEEPSIEHTPGDADKDAPEEPVNGEKTPEELSVEHTPGELEKDAPENPVKGEKTPEALSVEHALGGPETDIPLESVQGDKTPEELTAEDIPLDETPMEQMVVINISDEEILEKKEAHEHVAELVSKIDDLLGNNDNDIHMNFNSGREKIDLGDYDERHNGCFQMIATDMYLNNPDEFEQIMSAAYDKAKTEKEAHEHVTEWVSKIDDISGNGDIRMRFCDGKEKIDLGDYDERHSDHFRMIATDMYLNNPDEFEKMMSLNYDQAKTEIENSMRKEAICNPSYDSIHVPSNNTVDLERLPLDEQLRIAKAKINNDIRNNSKKEPREAEVNFLR